MAIRVRKLARELRRTPAEVLGLLHAVGYLRYRTPQDMLPDPVIERVRRAARDGVKPVVVDLPDSGPRPRGAPAPSEPASSDLMGKLVPGVVPVAGKKTVTPKTTAGAAPKPAVSASAAQSANLEVERAQLDAERKAVDAEREALGIEREKLDAERTALAQERDELAAERARLDALRTELEAIQTRFDAQLAEEREAESEAEAARLARRAGELLLLEGLRRVVVAGGTPEALKQLRAGLDARIDLRFVAGKRGADEASSDSEAGDAIVLIATEVSDEGASVYDSTGVRMIDAPDATSSGDVLTAIVDALQDDMV